MLGPGVFGAAPIHMPKVPRRRRRNRLAAAGAFNGPGGDLRRPALAEFLVGAAITTLSGAAVVLSPALSTATPRLIGQLEAPIAVPMPVARGGLSASNAQAADSRHLGGLLPYAVGPDVLGPALTGFGVTLHLPREKRETKNRRREKFRLARCCSPRSPTIETRPPVLGSVARPPRRQLQWDAGPTTPERGPPRDEPRLSSRRHGRRRDAESASAKSLLAASLRHSLATSASLALAKSFGRA
jgi:hypothetical protein